MKTFAAAIIEAGRELLTVKEMLDHGEFGSWIQAQCGISISTAENYMNAARFSEGKIASVAILPPTTVYRLAAKNARPEIVADVLERAAHGEIVPENRIRKLLGDARQQKRGPSKNSLISRGPPFVAPQESQHDRDLRMLRGVLEASCVSAREELLSPAQSPPISARGPTVVRERVRQPFRTLSGFRPPHEVVSYFAGTDGASLVSESIRPAVAWLAEFSNLWEEKASAEEPLAVEG
jgi:hypothetical protein